MSLAAILLGVLGVLLAGIAAAADGAVLSGAGGDATIDGDPRAEAEQKHRALSLARLVAYVTTGAAFGYAGIAGTLSSGARMGAGIAVVLGTVALCEGAARAIGHARPDATLRRLAPVVGALRRVLGPLSVLGVNAERSLDRIMPPAPMDEEEREASTDQFREVVAAEAEGDAGAEDLLHGVFSLDATEVHEIMVPRVDIVGIEATAPWSEVLDRVRSAEHARFPVFEESLDDVVGILYAKDLLAHAIRDEEPAAGWASLVRPAVYIPRAKTIDVQLRDFKQSRTHIAIVSDEYGGTAGLITIEDILEEIVGEIRDENDVEQPEVEREGDSRFWMAGKASVDDVRELLGTDFGCEEVATVGGLVFTLVGRVPRNGETLVRENFRIVVERVRRRRIERVYFERLEPAGAAGRGDREDA